MSNEATTLMSAEVEESLIIRGSWDDDWYIGSSSNDNFLNP
jgi:hypothetical protein